MTSWYIKGREFSNCNCGYGCPCQFNTLPTDGDCTEITGCQVDQGYFGEVKLDGLRVVAVYSWPGPIHEGDGRMQIIVDETADNDQRDALLKIVTGKETEEMATMCSVFSHMVTDVRPTRYEPIDFEVNVDARTARLLAPGLVEARGEPIRNAVTGDIHRARIDLPNGFEFLIAEMGGGTSKSIGDIELSFTDSYGQFANIEAINTGVVRSAA